MTIPDHSFSDFSTYLLSTGTSRNTYKNYLSDIRYFLSWLKDNPLTDESLVSFRDHLGSTQPIKTANRRLSSLRKFCRFLDQPANISNLSSHPAIPPDPILPMLKNFSSYLKSTGASDSTVKNYLSDARHFWEFLQTPSPSQGIDTFSLYRQYLMLSSSPATISRRLSSAKKFLELFPLSSLLPAPNPPPAPEPEPAPAPPALPPDQHPIETPAKTTALPKKTLKIRISDRTIYIVATAMLVIITLIIGYLVYRSAIRPPALIDPTLP